MLGKDAVQRGAGFRVNSLVQVNAAYFGAGVWLINVLRPPPPRSSSRGTEGSNPFAPPASPPHQSNAALEAKSRALSSSRSMDWWPADHRRLGRQMAPSHPGV